MLKYISLAALALTSASGASKWTPKTQTAISVTGSLNDKKELVFETVVPKNAWFGLGFGENGTVKMIGTDIIFFSATAYVDDKKLPHLG